jgi:hypothetical protein
MLHVQKPAKQCSIRAVKSLLDGHAAFGCLDAAFPQERT